MIKMFHKRLKNRKGFTLVELIVVIAILGILAGIAVPRLGASRQKAQEAADLATAKVILSAVALVEAEGKDMTAANINEYLNENLVADPAGEGTGRNNNDKWYVILESNQYRVYKGTGVNPIL